MARTRSFRWTAVLVPASAAAIVLAIALPAGPGRPSAPVASDVWPGFEGGEVALADLSGLMLRLSVERRDQRLEMRLENSRGEGFLWPVGDLYSSLDQHWVGLLEPGEWRIFLRSPEDPRPLAERRFTLLGGRSHGLRLDLRDIPDEEWVEFRQAIEGPMDPPPADAHWVHLDELFAARRAREADPLGQPTETLEDGPRREYFARAPRGEVALVIDPWGVELVRGALGESHGALRLEPARVQLDLLDETGAPLGAETRLWWSLAPDSSAPTLMWRPKEVLLDDSRLVCDTVAGELRILARQPGGRPLSARVQIEPGENHRVVALKVTSRR